MKCIVVTPEKTVFDKETAFVALPLFDGEYGIGNNHTPIVGRLGSGELRLKTENETAESWYIEGGFVEVLDNVITLLTNFAVPSRELSLEKAQNELETAQARSTKTPELLALKEKLVQTARSQIRLAQKMNR
ncbi:MAG: ATP synthase F1 subunit epsilon [Planctomycetia bacterium]|nr:ATP synthase F1 subunit epsilon [Planctomycetia bacterium]